MVRPVDQADGDRSLRESASGVETTEPATDDDDVRSHDGSIEVRDRRTMACTKSEWLAKPFRLWQPSVANACRASRKSFSPAPCVPGHPACETSSVRRLRTCRHLERRWT